MVVKQCFRPRVTSRAQIPSLGNGSLSTELGPHSGVTHEILRTTVYIMIIAGTCVAS